MAATQKTKVGLSREFVNAISEVIKMLGHSERILMLEYIRNGEKSVNQIAEKFALTQPITSQHLRLMRDKGVVECRREGSRKFYSLPNPLVHKMLDCLLATQEEMNR
jgi:ArsR family transcriptional regulator